MDLEHLSALAHTAGDLSLPDPLESAEGDTVETPEDWKQKRRPEILELFREHVYGRSPGAPEQMHFDVFDENRHYLGGRAVRKQIAIHVASNERSSCVDLLIFLLSSAKHKPVPVFVLLNFGGNHTVHPDAAIVLPKGYVREEYSPAPAFRGIRSGRYPVDNILACGYGLATAYYGDIDPDFHDGFKNGVPPLFDPPGNRPP